jgi:hypothetical protein
VPEARPEQLVVIESESRLFSSGTTHCCQERSNAGDALRW